jgi:RNA polymerase sigma-70 factor (ECF subfamily)
MTDSGEKLIEQYINGDRAAFEKILRLYGPQIMGYLNKMLGNYADAQDIFQETFKKVHQKAHTFRGNNLQSWLYRIATNNAINNIRKQNRSKTISLDTPAGYCSNPNRGCSTVLEDTLESTKADDPSNNAQIQEQKLQVILAIDQLSPKQRTTLILAYYNQLKYSEIAEILDCSIGTVKTQMFRALRSLANKLPDIEKATL